MGEGRSRRVASIVVVFAILAPSAMVGGCSLFTSLDGLSSGSDAPDSATCSTCDGGLDVNVGSDSNSPSDGSILIDDATSDPDRVIPSGSFICGGSTVDDCADCPGSHQPCVTCDNSGVASSPYCVKSGDQCRDDLPPGLSTFNNGCDCSGGASMCPEAYQVCHSSMFCHTCGEPMSNGETCQDGTSCTGMKCN